MRCLALLICAYLQFDIFGGIALAVDNQSSSTLLTYVTRIRWYQGTNSLMLRAHKKRFCTLKSVLTLTNLEYQKIVNTTMRQWDILTDVS